MGFVKLVFLFLSLISLNSWAQTPFARVTQTSGRTLWRLAENLHWEDLDAGVELKAGDQIKTGFDGQIILRLSPETTLELGILTQVSILRDSQGTYIRIDKGVLRMNPFKDGQVRAYSRGEVRDFVDAKTEKDATPPKEEKLTEEPSEAEKGSAKESPTKAPDLRQIKSNPPNKTLVLHSGHGKVVFQPIPRCLDACRVQLRISTVLSKTQKIQTQEIDLHFEAGQNPTHVFDISNATYQREVEWTLDMANQKSAGAFSIKPLLPEQLKKALDQGRNVEVLD